VNNSAAHHHRPASPARSLTVPISSTSKFAVCQLMRADSQLFRDHDKSISSNSVQKCHQRGLTANQARWGTARLSSSPRRDAARSPHLGNRAEPIGLCSSTTAHLAWLRDSRPGALHQLLLDTFIPAHCPRVGFDHRPFTWATPTYRHRYIESAHHPRARALPSPPRLQSAPPISTSPKWKNGRSLS